MTSFWESKPRVFKGSISSNIYLSGIVSFIYIIMLCVFLSSDHSQSKSSCFLAWLFTWLWAQMWTSCYFWPNRFWYEAQKYFWFSHMVEQMRSDPCFLFQVQVYVGCLKLLSGYLSLNKSEIVILHLTIVSEHIIRLDY